MRSRACRFVAELDVGSAVLKWLATPRMLRGFRNHEAIDLPDLKPKERNLVEFPDIDSNSRSSPR